MEQQRAQSQEEWLEKERRKGTQLVKTKSGKGYKPGGSQKMFSDEDLGQYESNNVNMGGR